MTRTHLKMQLVFLALLFSACTKDDAPSTQSVPQITLNELEHKLVGSWKITSAYTYNMATLDTTNELRDCMKEDVFTFRNNRRYDLAQGKDNCSPYNYYGSNRHTDVAWEINADSVMSFPHWFHADGPKIIAISDSKFVLRRSYFNMGNHTAIYTFSKQ